MNTYQRITQFLNTAHDPDNLKSCRETLSEAIVLLQEVRPYFKPQPGWDGVDDFMPAPDYIDFAKPEDRL